MESLFPIFLKLRGKPVLVVGSDLMAQEKIELLVKAEAQIFVVSRKIEDEFFAFKKNLPYEIRTVERSVRKSDVKGHCLIFSALKSKELNSMLAKEARHHNIWFNAIDKKPFCEFFVPSIIRRGPFQLALSSHGKSPGMVKGIRIFLESLFPDEHLPLLQELNQIRARMIDRIGDPKKRFFALKKLMSQVEIDYFGLDPQSNKQGIRNLDIKS